MTQVEYLPVIVTTNGHGIETFTSESGYTGLLAENHGLEPGRHRVTITPAAGGPVQASTIVIDPGVNTGIISDVDDTVMITWLPRPMLALWNSLALHINARKAVSGISGFHKVIIEPGSPVLYPSTGVWDTAPTLSQFILEHNLPDGPLLLTGQDPTPTGLFRPGKEHEMTQLRSLLIMFPHVKWILVDDNEQHGPLIYADLTCEHPSRVEFIVLRQLNAVEQVLTHGMPRNHEGRFAGHVSRHVPIAYGRGGYELLAY